MHTYIHILNVHGSRNKHVRASPVESQTRPALVSVAEAFRQVANNVAKYDHP